MTRINPNAPNLTPRWPTLSPEEEDGLEQYRLVVRNGNYHAQGDTVFGRHADSILGLRNLLRGEITSGIAPARLDVVIIGAGYKNYGPATDVENSHGSFEWTEWLHVLEQLRTEFGIDYTVHIVDNSEAVASFFSKIFHQGSYYFQIGALPIEMRDYAFRYFANHPWVVKKGGDRWHVEMDIAQFRRAGRLFFHHADAALSPLPVRPLVVVNNYAGLYLRRYGLQTGNHVPTQMLRKNIALNLIAGGYLLTSESHWGGEGYEPLWDPTWLTDELFLFQRNDTTPGWAFSEVHPAPQAPLASEPREGGRLIPFDSLGEALATVRRRYPGTVFSDDIEISAQGRTHTFVSEDLRITVEEYEEKGERWIRATHWKMTPDGWRMEDDDFYRMPPLDYAILKGAEEILAELTLDDGYFYRKLKSDWDQEQTPFFRSYAFIRFYEKIAARMLLWGQATWPEAIGTKFRRWASFGEGREGHLNERFSRYLDDHEKHPMKPGGGGDGGGVITQGASILSAASPTPKAEVKGSSGNRRAAFAPRGGLLVGMRGRQKGPLVERAAYKL